MPDSADRNPESSSGLPPEEIGPAPAGLPPETPRRRRRFGRWVLIGLGLAAIGMVIFAVGATVWEWTNSPQFCGTTCHTMPPEYTAYMVSPHARVACVDCHLGQESVLSTIPRKAMEIRHVVYALTQNYETPIYVKSMRPARDTCEKCHFPEKFSGDTVREVRSYEPTPGNDETRTWLLLKTGGGTRREGLGKGIHWHIENEVYYASEDELHQKIPYVRRVDPDGVVTEFFDVEANLPADYGTTHAGELRRMDCIDCHNRISHQFRSATQLVDEALTRGRIDRDIPDIKLRSTEVLGAEYAGHAEADAAIERLDAWYQANHADYYKANREKIQATIEVLKAAYRTSVFPEMDVGWETHPDNNGHTEFPGCFRCHDGKHLTRENQSIRLECNICHTVPAVQPEGQPAPNVPLERASEPDSHKDSNWINRHRFEFDATCGSCHSIENPGGTDNSSFCSNSACHARTWEFAGFDAPGIRKIVEPSRGPGGTQANTVPHPIGARTDCSICHGFEKVHPMPQSHASFQQNQCTTCHRPTLQEAPAGATPTPGAAATPAPGATAVPAATAAPAAAPGTPSAVPHPVAGREQCSMCHNPTGGMVPAPADHAGRPDNICTGCHRPAS